MNLNQRINAFVELGTKLKGPARIEEISNLIEDARHFNPWFTNENMESAINAIAESLTKEKLEKWLKPYVQKIEESQKPKRIGVIMAGNIPLVGFHDFLCVLISGNQFLGKLSSVDRILLPKLSEVLIEIEPEFKEIINFTEEKLEDFDAIIATGSNNTSRYFEAYFSKYPNIIRKNRNGIAVLAGNESPEQLELLADDVFLYFGLGCRNVSKLFVPKNYDFATMMEAFKKYEEYSNHNKYFNNYEYNKAIYLVNSDQHYDNGFVLLKEDNRFSSPISVLYFEYYDDLSALKTYLDEKVEEIQCIVADSKVFTNSVEFGKAQHPELWDYADGIDTMEFLFNVK
ncbi:MAG: acyl-CoA reductase [Bacteroidetes bacterium]|nr:acyl-CoA reductase [Bacteroidota bacterium]